LLAFQAQWKSKSRYLEGSLGIFEQTKKSIENMTTAFLARYSKKQKQTILIIEENISKDWVSIDPNDDSHVGPSIDMYVGPVADLCTRGDVFVTQDADVLMLTVQFRNGFALDVKLNKLEGAIEKYDISPDTDIPEDINEMVMCFIDYMVSTYSDD
jgi:hypothetical protein